MIKNPKFGTQKNQLFCDYHNFSQIVGVFFGKDEILLKLLFKGLNYHNFHIFYHN